MEDRAERYRKIAAEVRAMAATMSEEHSRAAMLAAADIWDRLAALAEQSIPVSPQTSNRRRADA
jgi:hypothetical protein